MAKTDKEFEVVFALFQGHFGISPSTNGYWSLVCFIEFESEQVYNNFRRTDWPSLIHVTDPLFPT